MTSTHYSVDLCIVGGGIAGLCAAAGDPEPLRSGVDRRVGDVDNGWRAPLGAAVRLVVDATWGALDAHVMAFEPL